MVECGAELSEQVGLQDNFLFLLFSLVKGTTWEWQNLSVSVVHGWYVLVQVKVQVLWWIFGFWPISSSNHF
jgi:hypothetical protein